MQAYQRKTEKFFVSKEKKFYRIGYWYEAENDTVFISVGGGILKLKK